MQNDFAVMYGDRMFTLKKNLDPLVKQYHSLKYVGFCDGDRVGFFPNRKAFEAFIRKYATDGTEQQKAARLAELRSTAQGVDFLNDLEAMSKLGMSRDDLQKLRERRSR